MVTVRGQITITNVNDGTPAYISQPNQSFLQRETAGGMPALPEGSGYIEAIKGNSLKWNQVFVLRNGGNISWSNNVGTVVSNADTYFSMSSVSGHKYVFRVYVSLVGKASFGIPSQNQNQKELQNGWNSWLFTGRENSAYSTFDDGNRSEDTTGTQFSNMQLFDLTLIFGAGNEPTTVEDFESWLADNVGLQDYYDYDAGSLVSVKMTGLQSKDSNGNILSIADVPVTTMTGKLNGTGDSVNIFPDGLKKAGSVYDEVKVENRVVKAVKRIGSVDLGTLAWSIVTGQAFTSKNFATLYKSKGRTGTCARYNYNSSAWNMAVDKTFDINTNTNLYIADTSYSNAETFKAAMSGVMLYYELATPEEYIIDDIPLPAPYKVEQGGTETILPENTSTPLTAKPTLDLWYGANATYL